MYAATVLDWFCKRWTIETWFRTLKIGTRIKDRRLDAACARAETPATEVFPEEDVDLLHTMLESQGHRDIVRRSAGHRRDIRAVVIDLGCLVGAHPNPRQPLPGTKKVWQGLE